MVLTVPITLGRALPGRWLLRVVTTGDRPGAYVSADGKLWTRISVAEVKVSDA